MDRFLGITSDMAPERSAVAAVFHDSRTESRDKRDCFFRAVETDAGLRWQALWILGCQYTSRTRWVRLFSRAHLLIAGFIPSVGTLCEAAFSCVVVLVLMPAYLELFRQHAQARGPREPWKAPRRAPSKLERPPHLGFRILDAC